MSNINLDFKISPDELRDIVVKHLAGEGYNVKPGDIEFELKLVQSFFSVSKYVFDGCKVNFSGEVVENALKNIRGE